MKIDEIEFKVICIKDCKDEGQFPWNSFNLTNPRKIKKGEIFTTNNFDFFYTTKQFQIEDPDKQRCDLARLYSSNGDYLGDYLGLFNNSNFMKLEEYRNIKIEKLLD